jgi:Protein of unknown function DUF262/Protein of unknown function (DUF1524)
MSVITPTFKSVHDLLKGKKFAIDEYQREYKWGRDNIVELLDDLLSKFMASWRPGHLPREVAAYDGYFLGSIIVSERQGRNYLIDGQQRTTSLTLLLIFVHHLLKDQGQPHADLAGLIFSDDYGDQSYNLDIPERRVVLDALFKQEPFDPSIHEVSVQTMFSRYQDIEAEFPEELREPAALLAFRYWLAQKVGVIEIACTSDDYAYAIFETMNDRGKPLSPTDMLKAYLLAKVSDPQRRQLANAAWKQQILSLQTVGKEPDAERDANCIKAWLRDQHADTIRERSAGAENKDWDLIGSAFHRWVRDQKAKLALTDSEAHERFIQRGFFRYAKVYETIIKAQDELTPGLESVFYNADNEFTWQPTVLLAAIADGDSDDVIMRKLQAVATYLDIWLIRRVVNYIRVSYSSSSYAMFLLVRAIRGKTLPELVDILTNRLAEDDATLLSAKNGERQGIPDLRLNQFSKRYIHHILARMTSYVEVAAGQPNRFANYVDGKAANPFEIEHIWANRLERHQDEFSTEAEFQQDRNHIGGLLLLPSDFNRSYQDKPYSEKLPHYATQNLLAKSLAPICYQNNPQFLRWIERTNISFQAHDAFKLSDQLARRRVYQQVAELVWSPQRIHDAASI